MTQTTRSLATSLLLLIGVATSASAQMTSPLPSTYLKEDQITIKKLQELAEAALMEAVVDSDGDLKITDGGRFGFIRVDAENKWLRFMTLYGFREGTPTSAKIELANEINNRFKLIRASVKKQNTLLLDYHLSYKRGINPYQVMNTYRLFLRFGGTALQKLDESNIVK